MTDLLATPREEQTSATPRAGRRVLAWAAASVLLLAAVVAGAWWLFHPDLLSYGNAIHASDVAVGESMLFDSGISPATVDDSGTSTPRTVTITKIVPRVQTNEAEAGLTLWLCTRAGDTGVGSVAGDVRSRYCDPATQILDQAGAFTYDRQQILVEITPSRPGQVVLRGFDVTYSDGLRRGTEHAGNRISLAAVPD
jgi:hypothetical protein